MSASPAVSIGLAVFNDPEGVRRPIESVLSQSFTDLELVICDNASNDDTVEVVNDYARQDRRVRVAVNDVNIGSHENMNRVFDLSRGTFFRWISADDWLESHALADSVQVLERRPDAVGVTSGFSIHTPGRPPRSEQYRGEFPTSSDAAERFARMLWFFHAGETKYDPVYGVFRREYLLRSGRVRPNERTDWLLSVELALLGPILHIDEILAHRTKTYPPKIDRVAFRRRLDPSQGERLKTSATDLTRRFYQFARSANLDEAQLRTCQKALARFWVLESKRTARTCLADAVHRIYRR